MGRQPVQVLHVVTSEAPIQTAAEALGGLGRVLGDIPGDLLSRQLPRLAVLASDVVDVELRAQRAYRSGPPSTGGQGTHTAGTPA